MNDLSAALFAPVEGVDVEDVQRLINERITLNRARTSGTDRSAKTAARIAQIGATLLASTPALAREVKRLRAEAADTQRAHAETLDYLLEQRDALTTRLSAIHDELLSMAGSSPAITDPPNVWRQFVSELADLADEGKALPLFQRLVERTAAALGLDKERLDPETGETYLPSWHDIPEQVSKLREENARLLAIADACQHWSTRAIRAEAALEEHLASKESTP